MLACRALHSPLSLAPGPVTARIRSIRLLTPNSRTPTGPARRSVVFRLAVPSQRRRRTSDGSRRSARVMLHRLGRRSRWLWLQSQMREDLVGNRSLQDPSHDVDSPRSCRPCESAPGRARRARSSASWRPAINGSLVARWVDQRRTAGDRSATFTALSWYSTSSRSNRLRANVRESGRR